METIKSSKVRTELAKTLTRVLTSHEDIGIEHNGQIVAVLTERAPKRKIPSIHLSADEARTEWAQLLEAVAVRGARFFFRNKAGRSAGQQVHLIRHEDHRNRFAQAWVDHVSTWRAENQSPLTATETIDVESDAIREIKGSLELANDRLALVFALINRGGDLYNTPALGTVPLRSKDDLERYEAD